MNMALRNLRKRRQTQKLNMSPIQKLINKVDAKINNQQPTPLTIKPLALDGKDKAENSTKIGMKEAFLKMIERKRQEQITKQRALDQMMDKSQDSSLGNKPTMNLRQLAQNRLGMKLKRQEMNLFREVQKIRIEDRADRNKLYGWCYKISRSDIFQKIISGFIIINTVVLALDKYPEDKDTNQILNQVNYVLTFVFLFEMIIKFLGVGLKGYIMEAFNIFDAIIVILSITDFIASFMQSSLSGQVITAFRAFRLIRIFKLAKAWSSFQNLLHTIANTLKDVSSFAVLLLLFIFIYALLGLEIFAYKAKFDAENNIDLVNGVSPDKNFDTIIMSMTTTFIVLTNDKWTEAFFDYYRTAGPASAIIFFVSFLFIGQKILLNLFLATVLENFDENTLQQELKAKLNKGIIEHIIEPSKRLSYFEKVKLFFAEHVFCCCKHKIISHINQQRASKMIDSQTLKGLIHGGNNSSVKSNNQGGQNNANKILQQLKAGLGKELEFNKKLQGSSLGFMKHDNVVRKACLNIVESKYFNWFILLFIFLTVVQLAMDSPLNDPQDSTSKVLKVLDIMITVIFSLEAVLKIIAYGFAINGKYSYLQSAWNVIDLIVIVLSILSVTNTAKQLQSVKMFRIARILRLLEKNEGLKLAFKALLSAIPEIISVSVVTILFLMIFAIFGVSYFKGQYFYCYYDNLEFEFEDEILNKWDCLNIGGLWLRNFYNFDNFIEGMNTMIQMSTTKWSDILFAALKSNGIDNQPTEEPNKLYWILFFVFEMLLCTFFLVSLYVGAILISFNKQKEKVGGSSLMTQGQKEWIDAKMIALRSKPIKKAKQPKNKIRSLAYKLEKMKWFDKLIFICVLCNTLILSLKWYGMPANLAQAIDVINQIFTGLFTVEAIIKLMAFGKAYFKDHWNVFDFTIVVISIASIFLSNFSSLSIGGATTIIRAFRIVRIFKFIKSAKKLKVVFNTFIFTIPALANVGGLLVLLLIMFAILGMNLFGTTMRNGIIDDVMNFENFWNSFLCMFIISTGDQWVKILTAISAPRSNLFQCINDPTYDDFVANNFEPVGCGNPYYAYTFVYVFMVLVNLIFLNLFIAIVLEGYEETLRREGKMFNQDCLDQFKKVWSNYDPDATSFIKIYQLKDFLFDLGKPLGWDSSYRNNILAQDEFVASLELPIHRDLQDYFFVEVLEALAMKLVVDEQLQLVRKKQDLEKKMKDSLLDESSESSESSKGDKDPSVANMSKAQIKEKHIKELIENDLHNVEDHTDSVQVRMIKKAEEENRRASTKVGQIVAKKNLSSLHIAAAQVAVSHMKYLLAKKKLMHQINKIEQHVINQEPSVLALIQEEAEEEKIQDDEVVQVKNMSVKSIKQVSKQHESIHSMKREVALELREIQSQRKVRKLSDQEAGQITENPFRIQKVQSNELGSSQDNQSVFSLKRKLRQQSKINSLASNNNSQSISLQNVANDMNKRKLSDQKARKKRKLEYVQSNFKKKNSTLFLIEVSENHDIKSSQINNSNSITPKMSEKDGIDRLLDDIQTEKGTQQTPIQNHHKLPQEELQEEQPQSKLANDHLESPPKLNFWGEAEEQSKNDETSHSISDISSLHLNTPLTRTHQVESQQPNLLDDNAASSFAMLQKEPQLREVQTSHFNQQLEEQKEENKDNNIQ